MRSTAGGSSRTARRTVCRGSRAAVEATVVPEGGVPYPFDAQPVHRVEEAQS